MNLILTSLLGILYLAAAKIDGNSYVKSAEVNLLQCVEATADRIGACLEQSTQPILLDLNARVAE